MQRYVYPVDLTEVEKELKLITEKLKVSKAEAIREAIRHLAEELRGLEVVEIRDVSKDQAKKEIIGFIKGKDRVWADEIADSLRLDLTLVNDILMELWEEGYVEPED
ncbi:winged helix-turn-helix domain-containing protein [Archaeoglobales archaeon]|nr:MAG: winged helix-turn-helix domain-containing protein [Archaeoglobales archaeon]RLI74893.1 MAG: winged helix-turn-helix domain-containing protein [Archaeoglobales archaeon]